MAEDEDGIAKDKIPNVNVTEQIEQCVSLLEQGSDERRFAGLLLCAKLLPQGNEEALHRVHSVASTFINRLLRSQDPHQQALACSICAALNSSSDVATSERMLKRCHLLASCSTNDAVDALLRIAVASPDGLECARDTGAMQCALHFIRANRNVLASLRLLRACVEEWAEPHEDSLSAIESGFPSVAAYLAWSDDKQIQLEALSASVACLNICRSDRLSSGWVPSVQTGLATVLGAQLNPDIRHLALRCTESATRLANETASGALLDSASLLIAVATNVRIEITVLLHEEVRYRSDVSNETCTPPSSHSKQEEQQKGHHGYARDAKQRCEQLGVCFALFELCVQALASSQDRGSNPSQLAREAQSAESVSLESIMKTLHATAESIVDFIEDASEAKAHAAAAAESETGALIIAAIKALGSFLAELPQAHEQRVRHLMPFMTTVQNGTAVPFLLPAMAQLAEDEIWFQSLFRRGPFESALQYALSTVTSGEVENVASVVHTLEIAHLALDNEFPIERAQRYYDMLCSLLGELPDFESRVSASLGGAPSAEVGAILKRIRQCRSSLQRLRNNDSHNIQLIHHTLQALTAEI